MAGVTGEMNGIKLSGNTATFDAATGKGKDFHHGEKGGQTFTGRRISDRLVLPVFRKKLEYGPGKSRQCCKLDMKKKEHVKFIKDCLFEAAKDFASKGHKWKYPGDYNCHSFQGWLLKKCCVKPPTVFARTAKKFGTVLTKPGTSDKGKPGDKDKGGAK